MKKTPEQQKLAYQQNAIKAYVQALDVATFLRAMDNAQLGIDCKFCVEYATPQTDEKSIKHIWGHVGSNRYPGTLIYNAFMYRFGDDTEWLYDAQAKRIMRVRDTLNLFLWELLLPAEVAQALRAKLLAKLGMER